MDNTEFKIKEHDKEWLTVLHERSGTTIDINDSACIRYTGRYKSIGYEIRQHKFNFDIDRSYWQPCVWCTYIVIDNEKHDKYKHRILDAPWNGGITFNEYSESVNSYSNDSPRDGKIFDKYFTIGDDFAHIWDTEHQRYRMYNYSYMLHHIKNVIDYIVGDKDENNGSKAEE